MAEALSSENTHFARARSGRRSPGIFVVILLLLTLYDVGVLVGALFVAGFAMFAGQFASLQSLLTGDGVLVYTAGVLLQNGLAFAPSYLLLWAWLRFFEKRPFSSLGLNLNLAALWQHLRGALVALVLVGGWVVAQAATGHLAFEGWTKLGGLGLLGFTAALLASYVGRAFQIGIEEALFRGWTLQAIGARYGIAAGVLLSSVFFSFFHFFHLFSLFGFGRLHSPWPPLLPLNIFLWAVFAALWILREVSLWGVIAFHATSLWAYNYVLGFGQSPALLDLRLVDPNWLTGGTDFAATFEGLPATALLSAGILTLLLIQYRSQPFRKGGREAEATPEV